MTPRQLLALLRAHGVYTGADRGSGTSARSSGGNGRVGPRDNRGSAGWLLAVARDLNRVHGNPTTAQD